MTMTPLLPTSSLMFTRHERANGAVKIANRPWERKKNKATRRRDGTVMTLKFLLAAFFPIVLPASLVDNTWFQSCPERGISRGGVLIVFSPVCWIFAFCLRPLSNLRLCCARAGSRKREAAATRKGSADAERGFVGWFVSCGRIKDWRLKCGVRFCLSTRSLKVDNWFRSFLCIRARKLCAF